MRKQVGRFEEWVRQWHAVVWRCAWRITRNAADADDVTQQVFVQLLEKRGDLESSPNPERALRWLAVKKALEHLRGERNRRRREEAQAMQRDESFTPPPPEKADAERALRSSLSSLPEELRLATVLRFQEGLTFAAMADALGVSEPTAFDRVQRALERLRARLTQLGHAALLADLERLLAVEETVAVPAAIVPTLLALAPAKAASLSLLILPAVAAVLAAGGGVIAARHWDASTSESARIDSAPIAAAPTRSTGAVARAIVPREAARSAALADSTDSENASSAENGLRRPWNHDLGRVRGRVIDHEGVAVSSAEVSISSFTLAGKGMGFRADSSTRDDGTFEAGVGIQYDDGQDFTLDVMHDGCVAHRTEPFHVKPAETTDLGDVRVRRITTDRAGDYTLAVTVRDPSGNPVQGALVQVLRRLESPSKDVIGPDEGDGSSDSMVEGGATTEAIGVVRLDGHRVGAKLLNVDARSAGFRRLDEPFTLEWTGFQEKSVALERGREICGRLRPPEGRELGAIRVHAVADDPSDWIEADVAPDGAFRIGGLDERNYTLCVDGEWSPIERSDVAAGRNDLELRLKDRGDASESGLHMGEIHGRIVEATSHAEILLAPEDVECEVVEDCSDEALQRDVLPNLAGGRMVQRATLFDSPPPSSRWHVVALEPGSYVVIARPSGHAPGLSRIVHVARDELVTDVVIESGASASADGVVCGPDGAPLADAFVFVTGDGERSRALIADCDERCRRTAGVDGRYAATQSSTDASGRFHFDALPTGLSLVFVAIHPKFLPASSAPVTPAAGANAGGLALSFTRARSP